MAQLEDTFKCPVIEAYGMTEAAHQMASNPLPPRARKPGSVGVAAGPDVAIMDDAGEIRGRELHPRHLATRFENEIVESVSIDEVKNALCFGRAIVLHMGIVALCRSN